MRAQLVMMVCNLLGFFVGYWLMPKLTQWSVRRSAERRVHAELLRKEQEKRERELLEVHIAQHQKLWDEQHSKRDA